MIGLHRFLYAGQSLLMICVLRILTSAPAGPMAVRIVLGRFYALVLVNMRNKEAREWRTR
jgi:hypothetical protein